MKILPFRSLRSHYGPILCCNPTDLTNILAISGEYGNVISNHIKTLPADSIFLDIGANYGLYSLLSAQHLTAGKVFSFEPNPVIYRRFLTAIELNKLHNIVPLNCAIGKEDGFLELKFDERHSGISSLLLGNQEDDKKHFSFTVPVFNIAKWKFLYELLSNNAVHVKIDVEGYETAIIQTLRQAPWYDMVKTMIVEIDNDYLKSFNSSAAELYKTLTGDGFLASIGFDDNKHYDEIFVRSENDS